MNMDRIINDLLRTDNNVLQNNISELIQTLHQLKIIIDKKLGAFSIGHDNGTLQDTIDLLELRQNELRAQFKCRKCGSSITKEDVSLHKCNSCAAEKCL